MLILRVQNITVQCTARSHQYADVYMHANDSDDWDADSIQARLLALQWVLNQNDRWPMNGTGMH